MLAFVGIFVVAYAALWFPNFSGETLLIVAVLGAAVGLLNIRKSEEKDYLIAVTALIIGISVLTSVVGLNAVSTFLAYIAVGFGVSGILTALYVVIRLGSSE